MNWKFYLYSALLIHIPGLLAWFIGACYSKFMTESNNFTIHLLPVVSLFTIQFPIDFLSIELHIDDKESCKFSLEVCAESPHLGLLIFVFYLKHTKFTVTSEERINKSAVLYLFFFSYADTIPEDFETFRSQQIQLFWTRIQQFFFFFYKINECELYISVMSYFILHFFYTLWTVVELSS